MLLEAADPELSENAVDAVIARPRGFGQIVWDDPAALQLIPTRLTEPRGFRLATPSSHSEPEARELLGRLVVKPESHPDDASLMVGRMAQMLCAWEEYNGSRPPRYRASL